MLIGSREGADSMYEDILQSVKYLWVHKGKYSRASWVSTVISFIHSSIHGCKPVPIRMCERPTTRIYDVFTSHDMTDKVALLQASELLGIPVTDTLISSSQL